MVFSYPEDDLASKTFGASVFLIFNFLSIVNRNWTFVFPVALWGFFFVCLFVCLFFADALQFLSCFLFLYFFSLSFLAIFYYLLPLYQLQKFWYWPLSFILNSTFLPVILCFYHKDVIMTPAYWITAVHEKPKFKWFLWSTSTLIQHFKE